ncbi:MAG: porphobilinogen deaminase [Watsoniomyces obsoletus]|nr:MAG: porphobilinogen deaminase [Watsoniomyces obsoletus]
MHSFRSISVVALLASSPPLITAYSIVDDYTPSKFFSMFDFYTARDLSNGFVQYIDQNKAQKNGLISTKTSSVYLGVDHKAVATNGRASVRISSKKSYTKGLFVADIAHSPGGICGTWPAFWTVGPDWPNGGEIDIMEQANAAVKNQMTLHTGTGCTINGATSLSSKLEANCDAKANNNKGCGTEQKSSESYGTGFNKAGGGVYAMEWTAEHIAIWFWSRRRIPANALSNNPDPKTWGEPAARFRGGKGNCDLNRRFQKHRMVFNITFCGDWAGNAWPGSTCAAKTASCKDFVANNPKAFEDAYWEINSLKVFRNA